METELSHLRSRVSSLQADLETSEAVQRDFVQLSQQLQVVYRSIAPLAFFMQGFVNDEFFDGFRFNWRKFGSLKKSCDGSTKKMWTIAENVDSRSTSPNERY